MIKATVSALADLIVPDGTVISAVRFGVTGPDAITQWVDVPTPTGALVGDESASFALTAAGDYVVSAQALDGAGAFLGAPVGATVTIIEPTTITVKVPGAITAEVV